MPRKPVTDPHKAWNIAHHKRLEAYNKRIEQLLNRAITQCADLALRHGAEATPEKPFTYAQDRQLKAETERLLRDLSDEITMVTKEGEGKEWEQAYKQATEYLSQVYNVAKQTEALQAAFDERLLGMKTRNLDALNAFQNRKIGGLKLSDKVWNYTQDFEKQMEVAIDQALLEGKSAQSLSRDIRSLLIDPDALFRRVRGDDDQLRMSRAMAAYHPGQGRYRSAYMNAMRLARSEINIAYRSSDSQTAQEFDACVGIEVHLSNNHNCKGVPEGEFYDICDELQGRYPKDFKFVGWHPQCYDEDSEVYTADGWKYFSEVDDNDLILSLNPETRDLEYVGILYNISRHYKGQMVHFFNRSYSQFVTPEHEVLCLSKQDNRTFRRIQSDKCGKTQPIYRSSEWKGRKIEFVTVGSHSVPFTPFAKFMGYWLSDGSLGHKYAILIAQEDADRSRIYDCIAEMGMKPRYNGGKIEFNDKDWYEYLQQFGKAADKFVPAEIKESDKDGIRIFLNAFVSCDGYVKKVKPFVGNRGNLCVPNNDERTYCTTSKRMADDIGELILKVGCRPSFRVSHTAGKQHQFKNGVYTINYDCITITECHSQCATQYNKEYMDYDGMVYDLTLERNNTMYIRRNGKCFWGSNCRCYTTYILKSDEEFWNDIMSGKNNESINTVDDVPDNFKKWLSENKERIDKAEKKNTLPYFLRDNKVYWVNNTTIPQATENSLTIQERAAIRHAARTEEERERILHDYDLNRLDKMRNNILDISIEKRGRIPDDMFSYVDEIETDIKNKTDHDIVRDKLNKLSRILTLYDRPQEGVLDYARGYALRSNVISDLLFTARKASGAELEAIKDKLVEKCAVATRYDLRNLGYTEKLSFEGIERDYRIGSDFKWTARNGKVIDVKSYTMDFVRFRDKNGFEFYYPISSEKRDFLFNASKISEGMETFNGASFIKKNTKGIMSVNKGHPNDAIFKELYPNFIRGAMYAHDPVTVHYRYRSVDDLLNALTHESAHHFDDLVSPHKSATAEWIKAVKKDAAFPTQYAKDAGYVEDFADSIEEYYKDKDKFTKKFPNRAALLDNWLKSF